MRNFDPELLEREFTPNRRKRRFRPRMIEEFAFMTSEFDDAPTSRLLLAGFLREDYPWLAELFNKSYRHIRAGGLDEIENEFGRLHRVMQYMMHHPIMRELHDGSKDATMLVEELTIMLDMMLHRLKYRRLEKKSRQPKLDTEASLGNILGEALRNSDDDE